MNLAILSQHLGVESGEVFKGGIEVDESYFGGTPKGKRGRGVGGKAPVFGVLRRGAQYIPRSFQMHLEAH